jgi:hypothetical protein
MLRETIELMKARLPESEWKSLLAEMREIWTRS